MIDTSSSRYQRPHAVVGRLKKVIGFLVHLEVSLVGAHTQGHLFQPHSSVNSMLSLDTKEPCRDLARQSLAVGAFPLNLEFLLSALINFFRTMTSKNGLQLISHISLSVELHQIRPANCGFICYFLYHRRAFVSCGHYYESRMPTECRSPYSVDTSFIYDL